MKPNSRKAFTLIELLIVSAIVAILAAIAILNVQEAQARGKVAKVRNDMRVIAGALEAYRLDNGAYPPAAIGDVQLLWPLHPLETPVAYLTSIPTDPFSPARMDFNLDIIMGGYNYKDRATTSQGMPRETYGAMWSELPDQHYFLHSSGPNMIYDVTPYAEYDPTNGTTSRGDISRFGPM